MTSSDPVPMLPQDPSERDAWAGEYVLGTLPRDRRRAMAAALPDDADLRDRVAAWERRLFSLTALSSPIEPPQGLWRRIETSLGWVTEPAERRPPGWWNHLVLWRSLAGAGFTAAVVLGVALMLQPPAPPTTHLVVLVAPQDKSPGWVVQASDARRIQLIPLGVVEVPADKVLEFWTKGTTWDRPVSLGLVKPGERLELQLDRLPPLENGQLFELTLEPTTGSPTGRPTGPIQFIGRAVNVL